MFHNKITVSSCQRLNHLTRGIQTFTFLRKNFVFKVKKLPKMSSPLKDLSNKPSPTKEKPFRVSVEGNIGAGKSTLMKHFENLKNTETHIEPIELWRNLNGDNLLDLMYSDINKHLKVFQSYVQLTRCQIQSGSPKDKNTVQIFERSIQNNRFCFVEAAFKSGALSGPDYAVLDKWYQWLSKNVNIDLDLIVYLRSSPEVVYKRIMARGRPEESGIPLDYLKLVHESHEEWLMNGDEGVNKIPVLVLDADRTLEDIQEQFKINERKILGKVRAYSNN